MTDAGALEPIYLTLEDVFELYAAIIGGTIGQAQDQLRNRSGLESALARSATHGRYADADLATQAAVLAHGIAEGQPFVDGNKRLALIAMLVFLEVNGFHVPVSDPELAARIIGLGSGTTSEDLGKLVRGAMVPVD